MIRVAGFVALALLTAWSTAAMAFDIEVLRDSGDPAERIDLIILGDGYRAEDQAQLTADATRMIDGFFQAPPYDRYAGFYNVTLVHVVSNERGGDRGTYGAERDTALGARFFCNNTERLLCINQGAVLQIAREHVPDFDFAFVIVNDPKYGGSGGAIGVSSIHNSAVDIVVHEFGHQLTGLADEYAAPFPGYPACPQDDCREPNVTNRTDPDTIKWRHFFEEDTPIPTPNNLRGVVGAYEGARYTSSGVFRPEHNCMMRELAQPFCAVCREATALAQYNRVSPLTTSTPEADPIIGRAEQITFAIEGPALELDGDVEVVWRVDGEIAAQDQAEMTLDGVELGGGVFVVSVQVRDLSPHIGADPEGLAQQSVTWTLTVRDPPSVPPQSVRLREDEQATFTLDAQDPDGDALTWQLIREPELGVIESFDPETGQVVYQPGPDLNGEDSMGVAVTDQVFVVEAEVALIIEPVNDPPRGDGIEVTLAEDGAQTFSIIATDPEDDVLALVDLTPPSHGEAILSEEGLEISYTPEGDFNGEDSLSVLVTDGDLRSAPIQVSIVVTPVPDAPLFVGPDGERFIFREGEASELTFTATDIDGDQLIFSAEGLPGGAAMSPEGVLSWAPVWTDIGEHGLVIAVSDGALEARREVVVIVEIVDEDGDGLARSLEAALGLDPENIDTDGDFIPDGVEVGEGLEASNVDGDADIDALDLDSDDDEIDDADEAGDEDLTTPPTDSDGDGIGDWREADSDDDGVPDGSDNCRAVPNTDQLDGDADGQGDACSEAIDAVVTGEDDTCGCRSLQRPVPPPALWPLGLLVLGGLLVRRRG